MTDTTFNPEEVNEVVNHSQPVMTTQKKESYMVSAKELTSDIFNPVVWQHMKGMADTFKASGAFGSTENAATLMVKMQAGREMGMTPIESIKSFYFVKGVINIFGAAVTRRLRNHGWIITFSEKENSCTATISKGAESYTDTLTFADAERSGWTKAQGGLKPGWYEGANRRLKLRYGVLSMIIKTYVPEVLGTAVDIAEIAEDTIPVMMAEQTQLPLAPSPHDDEPADSAQIKIVSQIAAKLNQEIDTSSMTKLEAKTLIFKHAKELSGGK